MAVRVGVGDRVGVKVLVDVGRSVAVVKGVLVFVGKAGRAMLVAGAMPDGLVLGTGVKFLCELAHPTAASKTTRRTSMNWFQRIRSFLLMKIKNAPSQT